MTSLLTDNGSRATMASLRCRLAPPMLTDGPLLPCHDVYICSEGNFQSKKAQNVNRLEGKDKEMAANDSCYKSSGSSVFLKSQFWAVSARVKPAGSRRPSGRRGRVLRLRRPSVNTHPSSNQKKSRSFRLDLQESRRLMEVDRSRSGLWAETCRDVREGYNQAAFKQRQLPAKSRYTSFHTY